MNTLTETLKKNAREEFDKKYGWVPKDDFLDALINETVTACAEAWVPDEEMPTRERSWALPQFTEHQEGWNACRAEMLERVNKSL